MPSPAHKCFSCLALAASLLATFAGCTSPADKVWYDAYRSQYDYHFMKGAERASNSDVSASAKAGEQESREDVNGGTAWVLYRPLAIWSLVAGVVGGIVAQYAVLLGCRMQQRLPLLLTAATVPGIRLSKAFGILELRTAAESGKEATSIELQQHIFRIRAIHQVVTKKLLATDNLDQLTQSRLLELANLELEKIVSDAERKYGVMASRYRKDLLSINCPNCDKLVRYSKHFAGQSRQCPNTDCNQTIDFPESA